MHSGVACVSCHTGLTYLLTRPALRKSLGEKTGPTLYEGVLEDSMRATVIRTDANDLFAGLKGPIVGQVYGAQVVLASLVLAMDDAPRGKLSPEGEKAFDRMWSLQLKSGRRQGRMAVVRFRSRSLGDERRSVLWSGAGGFGNRVGAGGLSGSSGDPGEHRGHARAICARAKRQRHCTTGCSCCGLRPSCEICCRAPTSRRILDELWRKQQADGGWTIQSLGPWKKRGRQSRWRLVPTLTPLRWLHTPRLRPECRRSQPNLAKALAWLKAHQDPQGGFWTAESMNHKHSAYGHGGEIHERRRHRVRHGSFAGRGRRRNSADASSSKPRN